MLFKYLFYGLFMVISTGFFMPASAQEQDSPCTAAVRVFEKTICREDITVEEEHISAIKQQFEDQGLDSDNAIKSRGLERLKDMIWEDALHRKFGQDTLEPTTSEVMTYSKAFKDHLIKSHEENIKTITKVENMLAIGGHSTEDEFRLRNLLQSLQTSITFYEEREKYNRNMPPEFHAMVQEAESEIARTVIRQWKNDKALYDAYGGRVVAGPTHPVPVDAYKKFLDYIRGDGALTVLDPEFEDVFAAQESFINGPHEAVASGDHYFSKIPSPYVANNSLPQN